MKRKWIKCYHLFSNLSNINLISASKKKGPSQSILETGIPVWAPKNVRKIKSVIVLKISLYASDAFQQLWKWSKTL